jgi:hypothetical protein
MFYFVTTYAGIFSFAKLYAALFFGMTTNPPNKSLSEKPLGYVLAVAGGLLGGAIGLFLSPLVLFFLGKVMTEEGDTKPKRVRAWALIGIIGAPLSFSLTSAIYSSNPDTSSTPPPAPSGIPSQPSTSSNSSQQSVPLGVEEQVKDDRAMKVTGSEFLSSLSTDNQFMEPLGAKGGKLVVVYVTIKNIGKESGNMFWSQFALTDSQGNKYADIEDFSEMMTVNMWAKSKGLAETGDQLFPGGTANSAIVFRVAPNANDLKLLVNDTKIFNIK